MNKLLPFLMFLSCGLNGQQMINGFVFDANLKQPLIGATIRCDASGTLTDDLGYYEMTISNDCKITVSYLGFQSITLNNANLPDTIFLQPSAQEIETLIVTGSKYDKRISESTVTVEVIKPELLQSTNPSKANHILDRIPGVQVVGGQANIRGGSGFSYGAGSRVMVLVDGMPALQADAGYANWSDLPIESLDQIEILKGASSALYGSSAMNGIINFRRRKPTSSPFTNVFTSFTNYLDPAIEISKWWDDIRYRFNIGISRVQKFKNLDINAHGFYSRLESFQKDSYEKRGRAGINLKYHLNRNLSIGVNSIFNLNDSQDFFLWDNDLRGLYKPFAGTLSSGKRLRYMIDPFIEYSDENQNRHKLFFRYFGIHNDNEFDRSNSSGSLYSEYQFQRDFAPLKAVFTGGIVHAITNTSAELFGDTSFTYRNIAAYAQLEKKYRKWSFSAGSRYEYHLQKSPTIFSGITIPDGKISDGALVNRLGINYKLAKHSAFRASWGQGYRFPTISERFIETSFGGFNVFPNPNLIQEYGWSAELGYNQAIVIKDFKALVDFSIFSSRYYDMIEFAFLSDPLGFKPINVGNTSIPGAEVSISTQGYLGPIKTRIIAGYTYIDPIYLNYDERPEIKDNLSTDQNVLKYRSKHSAKLDMDMTYRWIRAGVSVQHYSHMINIDKRLETPFDGVDLVKIKAFRDRYNKGYQIVDFRLGTSFSKWRINFILSNALNEVYTIRPGSLEAPRNITLRVDYTLQ